MLRIIVFIYVFTFVYLIVSLHDFLSAALVLLSIPVVVFMYIGFKKFQIKRYTNLIKKAEEKLRNGQLDEIKPIINVNRAPYYILELIPGMQRVFALKISNYRRKGIFLPTFEQFADFSCLPINFYPINRKILKF